MPQMGAKCPNVENLRHGHFRVYISQLIQELKDFGNVIIYLGM